MRFQACEWWWVLLQHFGYSPLNAKLVNGDESYCNMLLILQSILTFFPAATSLMWLWVSVVMVMSVWAVSCVTAKSGLRRSHHQLTTSLPPSTCQIKVHTPHWEKFLKSVIYWTIWVTFDTPNILECSLDLITQALSFCWTYSPVFRAKRLNS